MADATMYGESTFLNTDIVNKLENKTGVIISITEKETKFGKKLEGEFSFGPVRVKTWTLPYSAVNLFIQAWDKDWNSWIGKSVLFMTDKNKIVVSPVPIPK
jgi:hypothetical protein